MTFESIYKKYDVSINGKKTYLYALKNLSFDEAKKELKSRFRPSKVTSIKESKT